MPFCCLKSRSLPRSLKRICPVVKWRGRVKKDVVWCGDGVGQGLAEGRYIEVWCGVS